MESLAQRISQDGPLDELDAVGWTIRLAKRVEALHALGVFHGSISPACVITEGRERKTQGKLADVRATHPDLAYQSPERVTGGSFSAADDTWAVAATLYALLTGSAPYQGADEEELKQRINAASPSPLAVFDVGDDDLQHVIDAAFSREKARRTTGVALLRRALENWHPDPQTGGLPPLDDDEDSSADDEEEERTVLRAQPTAADLSATVDYESMRSRSGGARGGAPAVGRGARDQALFSSPRAGQGAAARAPGRKGGAMADPSGDEDDENIQTVMREYPANIGEAARAAVSGAPAAPPLRPAAGRPAEQPGAMFAPHGAAAARGAGMNTGPMPATPLPSLVDEDTSDLQATMMREAPLPPDVVQKLGPPSAGGPWGRAGAARPAPLRPLPAAGVPAPPPPPPPPPGFGPAPRQPAQRPHAAAHGPEQALPNLDVTASQETTSTFTQPMPAWPLQNTARIETVPAAMQQAYREAHGGQQGGGAPDGYASLTSTTPMAQPVRLPPPQQQAAPLPVHLPSSFGEAPGGWVGGAQPPLSAPAFPPPSQASYGPGSGAMPMPPPPQFGAPPPSIQQGPPDATPLPSDFRGGGGGVTLTAIIALLVTAAATFAIVRYGGCIPY